MKKKLGFFLLIIFCCGPCKAQQVVSSGGYDVKSEISVNWIIGGSLSDIPVNSSRNLNSLREAQLTESAISLKVYPVPATDFINLEITPVDTGRLILELYNNSGVKVLSRTVESQPVLQVNVRDIPSGAYFLKVFLSQKELPFRVEKIIKK
jgi:hypothetical protein